MRFSRKAVLEELERLYPDARPELVFRNPYETLIAVMLAAQCTDRQVNKVTPALFARYPDVAALAAADVADVYPMVKSCGFKTKASNIVEACRLIMQNFGGQVPGDMKSLMSLPGVGQKTANVVMAHAFGAAAIAVDTHVFRVSNRIGLAEAKNVEETERQLQKAIPKKDWVAAHHWLIFHGRRVCHARNPECGACTLQPWCKAAKAAGGMVITPRAVRKKPESEA